jgi:SAM-dependent methyltransferase
VLSLAFAKRRAAEGAAVAAIAADLATDDPKTVFSRVYRDNHWGRPWGRKFYSGPGSHSSDVVGPYVPAVQQFLSEFPKPPDVVDLGCGDFHVGRQLRNRCGRYTACDIVPELIRHNSDKFGNRLKVDFRCVDIIAEPLPEGHVVFIRQVLQHLSNEQIGQVIPKLQSFRYWVVTEHLPVRIQVLC